MARTWDPASRCLKVEDWPEEDRRAWNAALDSRHPLADSTSSAGSWRPDTIYKNRRGYGHWINHLMQIGADLTEPFADRVTPEQMNHYVAVLRERGRKPYTVRNRVGEVLATMLALAPERDWAWLKRLNVRLGREAELAADRSLPPILADEVLKTACQALTRFMEEPGTLSAREATQYRDWLMVAMLTLVPLRRRNFATLCLGKHLILRNGAWLIDVPAAETKTSRPYRAPLHPMIVPYLEHYLAEVRIVLLGGKDHDALWVARGGRPMTDHTINLRVSALMKAAFDADLSLHDFRSLTASTISVLAPAMMDTGRAQLGHTSRRTTQHHYVRADSLQAGRSHAQIVRSLRRKLTRP